MFFRKLFMLICIIPEVLISQGYKTDSIIAIKDVEIYASKVEHYGIGAHISKIDSNTLLLYQTSSLSDVMLAQTGASIKSYGPGGLATMSVRGGGTAHTTVIWNDLNLQSSTSSDINLSTIPVCLLDEVKIQHGGAGTLFGSGAVTGVVHLSNKNLLNKKNSLSISNSIEKFQQIDHFDASINNQSLAIKGKIGNKRIAGGLGAFIQQGDNAFEFKNTEKTPVTVDTQSNAELFRYDILGQSELRINRNSKIAIVGWYQYYNKDIQTLMTDANDSRANQIDNNFRSSISYKFVRPKYILKAKSGAIYLNTHYTNPALIGNDADSKNEAFSFINELENELKIHPHHHIQFGANYTHERGISNNYQDPIETRDRTSFFANYKLNQLFKKFNGVAGFRLESADGDLFKPVYSLGLDYKFFNYLTLKALGSKNYRVPSFNDLYWKRSAYAIGNPDLIPETGWSLEAGLVESFSTQNWKIIVSQTGFYNYIENWIKWLSVVEESGIWKPKNLDVGVSYGYEIQMEIEKSLNNSKFYFNSFYTYVHAEIIEDGEWEGKDMIYVPRNKLTSMLRYNYKKLSASFIYNYVDERYFDKVQTRSLDPYHIGNINLQYRTGTQKHQLNFTLGINNLWNTEYQVMRMYAMPIRHYKISINYKFY